MSSQGALFGGPERDAPKPARPDELEVLVTVKAAPNPSAKSGETVCVAGLGLTHGRTQARWIRLSPINFRFLEQDQQFKKYDILRVRATPASGDTRVVLSTRVGPGVTARPGPTLVVGDGGQVVSLLGFAS
jgi:hypothetical protein